MQPDAVCKCPSCIAGLTRRGRFTYSMSALLAPIALPLLVSVFSRHRLGGYGKADRYLRLFRSDRTCTPLCLRRRAYRRHLDHRKLTTD